MINIIVFFIMSINNIIFNSIDDPVVSILEDLLLVTTNPDGPSGNRPCILLTDTSPLNLDNINFVLFERLLLDTEKATILWPSKPSKMLKQNDESIEQVS